MPPWHRPDGDNDGFGVEIMNQTGKFGFDHAGSCFGTEMLKLRGQRLFGD